MKIFDPLYTAVSWVILHLHDGFHTIGMSQSWAWSLAIVGLVMLIRIALIPLFVKQIRSMRNMQVLQPEIKKIQERYKGDRERISQELMKLYKEHNTNPLASCLPVLAQSPFFLALYRVLSKISGGHPIGVIKGADVDSAKNATFFGAHLSDKFIGAHSVHVQIVTVVMILAMSGSQFYTQRQLMTKNMPKDTSGTPSAFMQQQKVMMYLFPVMFGVFGINFPVGVLVYWLVSNFWSMGQQLYVIRRMPAVGSVAHEAMLRRKGGGGDEGDSPAKRPQSPEGGPAAGPGASDSASPEAPAPGGRQQPQRQSRSQRGGAKKR
ncbi:MAG TPA: membrane protein insertase YidC [Sporichthyaceae bacterium]|jgi:YidC/Oxa1 family membrane protein insertase|nr:membrane protein insertase YidC [Sporichthyaceae bacterium]